MNTRTTKKKYANQLLSACAAAALVSAAAGTATAVTEPPKDMQHSAADAHAMNTLLFVSSADLLDTDLKTYSQESIGTVDDFILDRESGRIVFAIVSRGGVMGIGDEQFAIDFGRLNYVPETNYFEGPGGLRTDMTPEQAERQIEFLPEQWDDLTRTGWMDQIPGFEHDTKTSGSMDLNKSEFVNGDTTTVEGRITGVERKKSSEGEDIIVHVQGEDGVQRAVILGPSWYIMGMDNAPKPGDQAKINAVEYHDSLIATTARLNKETYTLRDDNGKAQWDSTEHSAPRYIRLTDLIGQDVEIAGTTGGEVQNAFIEMRSGQLGFIGFDPNDNLLGLGDEISLVPWGVLTVDTTDATIWSSAEESQFERAEPVPERIEDLNSRSVAARVYAAFGMEMPDFKPRHNKATSMKERTRDRAGNPWSHGSWLVEQFTDGKSVRLNGTFRGMESVRIHDNKAEATAMSIEVDGEKQLVVLGPSWYVEKQPFTVKDGDPIIVTGRSAKVDNREMIAAWKVDHGGQSMTLWTDSTPAWTAHED